MTRGERKPEAMAINKGQAGGDWRYFNCGDLGHIARNCNSERIVERNGRMIQVEKGEELKDNRGQ